MNPKPNIWSDFCIEIDFSKESRNPSRVFKAMSALIEAFQSVDRSLADSIDSRIEPVLLLEDIGVGSIKSWLKQIIEATDDESLYSGNFKQTLGRYLVRAKYLIVSFLENKTEITNAEELAVLESQLETGASEVISRLNFYQGLVSRHKLLNDIRQISTALELLDKEQDKAILRTRDGDTTFNLTFHIAPETIDALLTSEAIKSTSVMIVKIKKPEFLTNAQWDFKHDVVFSAPILDADWLTRFQAGQIPLRPGDALRATVQTEVHYGFDREVIDKHYSVLQILEVIPRLEPHQPKLPLSQ